MERLAPALMAAAVLIAACASPPVEPNGSAGSPNSPDPADPAVPTDQPSPAARAWMERLTVPHHYDPATGFIVADEVVALPAVLRDGPDLATAVEAGARDGRTVIAFSTADRCAPCQQFRLDTLNHPSVVARLSAGDLIAVHVEVDREAQAADRYLGSRGIPVSWRLVDGRVADHLPGVASVDELLAWLER
jgi:hypothetical protein